MTWVSQCNVDLMVVIVQMSNPSLGHQRTAFSNLVSQPTCTWREKGLVNRIQLLSHSNAISYAMFGLRIAFPRYFKQIRVYFSFKSVFFFLTEFTTMVVVISRCSGALQQSCHSIQQNVNRLLFKWGYLVGTRTLFFFFFILSCGNHTPGSRFYSDFLDILADFVCIHQLIFKHCSSARLLV